MDFAPALRNAGTALLLVFFLGGAGPLPASSPPALTRLVLSGSTTMAPLMNAIARRYERSHPGVQIEVRMGGSGKGIADARAGLADLGMVSRPLKPDESELYSAAVARDGIAVIVHRSNPVPSLSDAQLVGIYGGQIRDWNKVGGAAGAIHVLAGSAEGGSTTLIAEYLDLPFEKFSVLRKIGPNVERIAAVAADPLAIEYMSIGEAERAARAGSPIRLLPIGGVAATSAEVRSGRYPIARPLLLVRKDAPGGALRQFVAYCLSQQVNDLIASYEFVAYQN